MNEIILQKLSEITDEERAILSGNRAVDKALYTSSRDFLINSARLLRGKQIEVRPHTRFIDFPLHYHDYTEVMYVYGGNITHVVSGERITLYEGDLIFLNKHVKHSVERANEGDLGANFIFSDGFLSSVLKELSGSSVVARFIAESQKESGRPEYLCFSVADLYPVRNLLDNILFSILSDEDYDEELLSRAFSLLFCYLSFYKRSLKFSSRGQSRAEKQKDEISAFISLNFKTATLSALAEKMHLSEGYLSRLVFSLFSQSFKELLLSERLIAAEKLLLSTDMNVSDVSLAVGYENKSYFHKSFKQKHGTTPSRWRQLSKATAQRD